MRADAARTPAGRARPAIRGSSLYPPGTLALRAANPAVPPPRRILLLNERDIRHPNAGGAEVHCFEVYRRLAARGDEITLLAAGFPGAPAEEIVQGIRVVRLGARVAYYLQVAAAYRRLRRAAPFDVVNEQTNKFPYFARLWVHEPLVIWIHHLFGHLAFRQVAAPIALATFVAERMMPRIYRGLPVAAISPSTRDELVAKGFPAADVHVIPNAVDHAAYRPTSDPRAPVPTVVAVGRLEPAKGMHVLIDAVARLPGVHLVIAGIGNAERDLRAQIARLGVGDRVELRGFVPEAEKIRLMQTAHVFASASAKEGWGLSVLEAGRVRNPDRRERRAGPPRRRPARHDRPARTPRRPGVVRGGDPTSARRSRRARALRARRPRARRLVQLGCDGGCDLGSSRRSARAPERPPVTTSRAVAFMVARFRVSACARAAA